MCIDGLSAGARIICLFPFETTKNDAQLVRRFKLRRSKRYNDDTRFAENFSSQKSKRKRVQRKKQQQRQQLWISGWKFYGDGDIGLIFGCDAMKKFLIVACLVMTIFICGCGSKYSDETLIVDFAFWTEDRANIPDMLDAINTYDTEFLAQQVVDGKVKHADRETKIAVTDEYDGGKTVEIKFLEGRYKNKVGYTLAEFVKDIGNAREQEKAKQEQNQKEEQARREREQAAFDEAQAKENARLQELTAAKGADGQIVVALGDGTAAYHKIIGKTTLPEGTNLTVILANVKKSSSVHSGKFSALFERSAVSVGEQNLSITTSDGKQIYSGTIQIQ